MESMHRKKGGKLEWSESGRVRKGARRERKVIVSPRGNGSGSRRMMERGKEEEFACKIAKGTKGIKCEGEEEDLWRAEVGDDRFITTFSTCCFVVWKLLKMKLPL
jgi:hypothetical protein